MSVREVTVMVCRCERCGCEWIPRTALKNSASKPVRCANPKCNTPYWDIPKRQKVPAQ